MPLRRVVRVGHGARAAAVRRDPLPGTGRAQHRVPLEAEQVLQEAVVPPRRGGRPGALEAAGDRVRADAGAEAAPPAQALLLDRSGLRVDAEVALQRRAVGLAERVAADDQRDRLLVVHPHAVVGLPDVAARHDRVGHAVRTFGVDVDQAHLGGGQRIVQLADAACAARRRARRARDPSRRRRRAPRRRPVRRRSRGSGSPSPRGRRCPRRSSDRPRRACGRTSSSPATATGAPCPDPGCRASCSAARNAACRCPRRPGRPGRGTCPPRATPSAP